MIVRCSLPFETILILKTQLIHFPYISWTHFSCSTLLEQTQANDYISTEYERSKKRTATKNERSSARGEGTTETAVCGRRETIWYRGGGRVAKGGTTEGGEEAKEEETEEGQS